MKLSKDNLQDAVGKRILEIEPREKDDPSSASGGEEVEISFSDGSTLLFYVHQSGELCAETD